jgi:hypothetical protein
MASRRQYGLGAIGTSVAALATILFSNIQTTRDLLSRSQEVGGLPRMIADLVLNPAFQVILVIVAVYLGVRASRMEPTRDHGKPEAASELPATKGPTWPPIVGLGKQILTVHSARYGVSERDGEYRDVTEKLGAYGHKQKIDVEVTNEALNVGNPFEGTRKHLFVVYSVTSRVAVEERTRLILPPSVEHVRPVQSLPSVDKMFPPLVTQSPPITPETLTRAVYGRQVAVNLANLKGEAKEAPSIEITFFCFNGTNAKVSTKVSGKLLYSTWAIVPWTISEPKDVDPLTEFTVVVRMPLAIEVGSEMFTTLVEDRKIEIGLDRLEIMLTSASGASSPLDKPAAIQIYRGVQIGRVLAATAKATLSTRGEITR